MKCEIIDKTRKVATVTVVGELNGTNLPNLSNTIHELIEQGIIHLISRFFKHAFCF